MIQDPIAAKKAHPSDAPFCIVLRKCGKKYQIDGIVAADVQKSSIFSKIRLRRGTKLTYLDPMNRKQNLFLIGPMGAGKTTVGKQLAQALGMEFIDSDLEIQARTGVDIPTIFEFEGEEGFRRRERTVLEELTALDGVVLATGGGAVLDENNRRLLSSRGFVVYLQCSPEQQYERTFRDRNRPLLQTENPLGKLKLLMQQREPLYLQTADLVILSDRRSASAVAREIQTMIESTT